MRNLWPLVLVMPLLSACLGPVTELYPEEVELRTLPVWLVSNSWHVGIVIEAEHLDEELRDDDDWPRTRYVKFGWGDNRYYPHPDPGFGLLLRAALLPTRSVIHVAGIDIPIENFYTSGDIIKVMVSREGMAALTEFIANRFRRDGDGDIQFAEDGLFMQSVFYEARGFYYLPKTSNTWTARALRKTGAPITPIYAFTAGNVIRQVSGFGEVIQVR